MTDVGDRIEPEPRAPLNVLLVEDDPADVDLAQRALRRAGLAVNVAVVHDGEAAMAYLRRQPPYTEAVLPDLILLDLNLPRKRGAEVLAEIKADATLRGLPVVVLTTSENDEDIAEAYRLEASCYVAKPHGIADLDNLAQPIGELWLGVVKLPPEVDGGVDGQG